MGRTSGIELTPEQRAMIERKIAGYAGGDALEESRRASASAHALPLYLDWSACMAVRPDGEVIWIDYDEPHQVQVVEDERDRNLGFFQGSRRDPDLRWLIPPRPNDAIDCPWCLGTGRIPLPEGHEHMADRLVCYCGGLGWLPATSDPRCLPATGAPRDDRRTKRRRLLVRGLIVLAAASAALLGLSLLGLFP